MITLETGPHGTYRVVDDDGEDLLIQSDYEYPGLATTFGWNPCHRFTDGTVDCPLCKKTVSELISSAMEFLDDNIGKKVEDPGYFGE